VTCNVSCQLVVNCHSHPLVSSWQSAQPDHRGQPEPQRRLYHQWARGGRAALARRKQQDLCYSCSEQSCLSFGLFQPLLFKLVLFYGD